VLQCVAVSTGVRPVTHTADVETKRATTGEVQVPSADEIGRARTTAPSRLALAKPAISNSGADGV
jgi:hypothetical protein